MEKQNSQTNMIKKVSVIIPCYNVAQYLPSCFACIEAQTYKNLQVVFVNDGSTDGTAKALEEFCAKNPYAEVITTENKGVANARNLGVNGAKGELLTFYDADDVILPVHVENLVNVLQEKDADVAITSFKRVPMERAYDFKKQSKGETLVFNREEGAKQLLSHRKFDVCLWNKLYKTSIIKENNIKFIQSRYGEDNYFNYMYFCYAQKSAYTTTVTYNYVMRENSLTHESFNENRLTVYCNLNAIIEDSLNNHPEFIDYARYLRAAYSCEMLYFINKYKYKNSTHIAFIINSMCEDVGSIKKCKKVALYRRLFIPLVPGVAKMVFRKALKKFERTEREIETDNSEE